VDPVSQALAEELIRAHPGEAARVLEMAPASVAAKVLQSGPAQGAARVLPQLNAGHAASVLEALEPRHAAEALESMPFDQAVLLLRLASPEARGAVFLEANTGFKEKAGTMLRYPEDCVGAYMDPFALTLRETLTAGEANDLLHLFAGNLRNYLYVLDDARRLKGVISVRQLLPLDPKTTMREAMVSPVVSVSPFSKIGDLAGHHGWNSFRLLPVADGNGVFHGVLKFETLARKGRAASAEGPGLATGRALGELYGVGLQAVFRSGLGWTRGREAP
jgi:magnesium transporter